MSALVIRTSHRVDRESPLTSWASCCPKPKSASHQLIQQELSSSPTSASDVAVRSRPSRGKSRTQAIAAGAPSPPPKQASPPLVFTAKKQLREQAEKESASTPYLRAFYPIRAESR